MSFIPSNEHLEQVLHLLHKHSDPNPEVVAMVLQHFEQYSKRDDFNTYLAYIVGTPNYDEVTREKAALTLKNGIKDNYSNGILPVREYIQMQLLATIGDSCRRLRNAVAYCLSMLCKESTHEVLMQILQVLCQGLDSGQDPIVMGSMQALHNICSDCIEGLVDNDAAAAELLVPRLLHFLHHPDEAIRCQTLSSLVDLFTSAAELCLVRNSTPEPLPPKLEAYTQSLLHAAMKMAMETNLEIRTSVCRTLVFMADHQFEKLEPHIADTVDYILMIQMSDVNDDTLMGEACSFWALAMDKIHDHAAVKNKMSQIIEVLLRGVEHRESVEEILGDHDDARCPDKPQDIHPAGPHAHAKTGFEDDDDDSSEEDENSDPSSRGLRQFSTIALDAMATSYNVNPPFLSILLSQIHSRLHPEQSWRVREGALIALGAVAEGCQEGLAPLQHQFVRGLTSEPQGNLPPPLEDPHPLVRATACWTLKRIGTIKQKTSEDNDIIGTCINSLLARIPDGSKKVQAVACCSLETCLDEFGEAVKPFLQPLLHTFHRAFGMYQEGNMKYLYNCVISLCEAMGKGLNCPEAIDLLMPPLIHRWNTISDDDPRLKGLMSCMSAVANSLGPGFQPFVQETFTRSVRVLQKYVALRVQVVDFEQHLDEEYPMCCLELLGGLCDGLESSIEPLVAANPIVIELLHACIKDCPRVQQSALALFGDLCKLCYPHILPHISTFMPMLLANMEPAVVGTCNNAVWAAGELAVKAGPTLRQLPPGDIVDQIFDRLLQIIQTTVPRRLLENVCITIGRLGLVAPDVIAPHLKDFIKTWCFYIRLLKNDHEKEQAFLGMCQMIQLNPNGCFAAFAYICDAMCSWGTVHLNDSLKAEFRSILHGFKTHIGPKWTQYFLQFPPNLRQHLTDVYDL